MVLCSCFGRKSERSHTHFSRMKLSLCYSKRKRHSLQSRLNSDAPESYRLGFASFRVVDESGLETQSSFSLFAGSYAHLLRPQLLS